MDALFLSSNLPFTVALGVMLAIAMAEAMGAVFGLSPSGLIDQMLPDIEADVDVGVETDLSTDASAGDASAGDGAVSKVLAWLCVGRVPALVLLVAFLTMFGLSGLIIQSGSSALVGTTLPAWLASIGAIVVGLHPTRWFALSLARIMPREESEAVSSSSFVGRVATMTRGVARVGRPAEAKLRDEHGHMHYVLVEPDNSSDAFERGTDVLLISQSSPIRFNAILKPIELAD